jgi:hypothetical protein
MAISKYLEMLINGESPDDEPPPDQEEARELTLSRSKFAIRLEAFCQKAKPARRGFAIKKLSRCHQKAISSPEIRSDRESDSS